MKLVKQSCLCVLFVIGIVQAAHAACYDTEENYGNVARIYPQYGPGAVSGTFFSLKNGVTNGLGGNAYYHLSTKDTASDQAVYRSLHDLLVEAAKTNWTVRARLKDTGCRKNGNNAAEVEYLYVDF